MIEITVKYSMPDEQAAFARAHFADDAWSAIDRAMNIIRNFTKHNIGFPEDVIKDVQEVLLEVKSRVEV